MNSLTPTLTAATRLWTDEESVRPVVHPEAESAFRFTLDGSDELEKHLRHVCEQVADGVRAIVPAARLEGVLLAGGYGRGEGGVLKDGDHDRAYNDMEFYVFIRGATLWNDRRYKRALHELGERLSPLAGLEVEFKIVSAAALRRALPTMFSYDFVTKHHWVLGDDSLLSGCDHHRDAEAVPASEATRLLFNRCSGLLFAAARLAKTTFTEDDADFVGRNIAKAQLGIGDALLASEGCYHWSCLKRHGLLCALLRRDHELATAFQGIAPNHEAGVVFKLRPQRATSSREELAAKHAEISGLARRAWLHLESLRLQRHFSDAADYAASPLDKCPEQPRWKNVLVNVRTFGPSVLRTAKAARYPRERLFTALSLLLWTDWDHPSTLAILQNQLRTEANDIDGLVSAYEKLWHRFN